MAVIIRQRQVVADNWQLLKPATAGGIAIPAIGDVIVPFSLWREQREILLKRSGRLGVWLEGHDDPASIAPDLRHFEVIAVNFAQFTDGRGYSTARLLRERYEWRGELRAIGDVLRDQLFYLARCGFQSLIAWSILCNSCAAGTTQSRRRLARCCSVRGRNKRWG